MFTKRIGLHNPLASSRLRALSQLDGESLHFRGPKGEVAKISGSFAMLASGEEIEDGYYALATIGGRTQVFGSSDTIEWHPRSPLPENLDNFLGGGQIPAFLGGYGELLGTPRNLGTLRQDGFRYSVDEVHSFATWDGSSGGYRSTLLPAYLYAVPPAMTLQLYGPKRQQRASRPVDASIAVGVMYDETLVPKVSPRVYSRELGDERQKLLSTLPHTAAWPLYYAGAVAFDPQLWVAWVAYVVPGDMPGDYVSPPMASITLSCSTDGGQTWAAMSESQAGPMAHLLQVIPTEPEGSGNTHTFQAINFQLAGGTMNTRYGLAYARIPYRAGASFCAQHALVKFDRETLTFSYAGPGSFAPDYVSHPAITYAHRISAGSDPSIEVHSASIVISPPGAIVLTWKASDPASETKCYRTKDAVEWRLVGTIPHRERRTGEVVSLDAQTIAVPVYEETVINGVPKKLYSIWASTNGAQTWRRHAVIRNGEGLPPDDDYLDKFAQVSCLRIDGEPALPYPMAPWLSDYSHPIPSPPPP